MMTSSISPGSTSCLPSRPLRTCASSSTACTPISAPPALPRPIGDRTPSMITALRMLPSPLSGCGVGSEPERSRDDDLHDLAAAAVYPGDARITVSAADAALGHIAGTAVQLQAPVHDPALHLAAEQLRHRGLGGRERPGIEGRDGGVQQRASGGNVRR